MIIFSNHLTIVDLVGHYPTNYLIVRRPVPKRKSFNPKITCGISTPFGALSLTLGSVPTRYSAVRRSSAASLFPRIYPPAISPECQGNGEALLPLDLHVLGTPPAFILSQDQTLH